MSLYIPITLRLEKFEKKLTSASIDNSIQSYSNYLNLESIQS